MTLIDVPSEEAAEAITDNTDIESDTEECNEEYTIDNDESIDLGNMTDV